MLSLGQKHYESTFKEKIVKLHLEEGRTISSLVKEYGVSKVSIGLWIKKYREECDDTPKNTSPNAYYNFLRNIKKEDIFHGEGGKIVYRMIKSILLKRGIKLCLLPAQYLIFMIDVLWQVKTLQT